VRETLARHAADPGLSLGFRPRLSDDELAAWYSALHAYVFPSSGEGWSMTPRESMYLGIPTLVSDIAVHRDLLASGLCSAIPAAGLEDAYYPYQGWTLGRWHTITTDAIRSALVELHDHYDDKAAMAAEGARWIAGRWQWGDALAQIAALVAD
jgi:glycosyltransferase involved in cell wall biosynthesis